LLKTASIALALLLTSCATGSPPPQGASSVATHGIADAAAFDALARTQRSGRFMELPQLMFAIDRSRTPAHVIWINTRTHQFHFEYLRASYLTLAEEEQFNEANYSNPRRRFVLGSVVRYPRLGRYGVELWEGDLVEPALLGETMRLLRADFFAPLTFKPNSDNQLQAATGAGLATISVAQAYGSLDQLILNGGRATGRLIAVEEGHEEQLLPGDIALLRTVPVRMPPVAGIISASFTTPINHISLLAKSWGIPNVYRADAAREFAALLGQQVVLDARRTPIILRPATPKEIVESLRTRQSQAVRPAVADTAYTGLPALSEQDAGWSSRTGAKAANLAEVAALARRDPSRLFEVPEGFSIPFSTYDRFVAANGLRPQIEALLDDPRRSDAAWLRGALDKLRAAFAQGAIPAADLNAIGVRRSALLGEGGVFVRSSTNAEDLPGFNGAGLYDTVPNVRSADDLARAVRTVWGSLWNERAFAARERAGIDHRSVRAAVLVQTGIDADSAGVMTTVDPFDERSEERRLFIVAKRGLGIRVVEGKRIAEQLIYRPDLDSIQILTRSQDDIMLHFAPDGGVEEVKTDPDRAVLSDALVRRLGAAGTAIQSAFDGRPQDIEWLIVKDRIMIVQSRDYVRGQ
jgi:hypothetical protein